MYEHLGIFRHLCSGPAPPSPLPRRPSRPDHTAQGPTSRPLSRQVPALDAPLSEGCMVLPHALGVSTHIQRLQQPFPIPSPPLNYRPLTSKLRHLHVHWLTHDLAWHFVLRSVPFYPPFSYRLPPLPSPLTCASFRKGIVSFEWIVLRRIEASQMNIWQPLLFRTSVT